MEDSLNDALTYAPLLDTLAMTVHPTTEGTCEITMTVDQRHLRSLNMLHGGVTATLLDTALGFAVMSTAGEDQHSVTTQLNIHYLRAAMLGNALRATGEIVRRGRRTAVARGEVRGPDNSLIAIATGSFQFLPKTASAPSVT